MFYLKPNFVTEFVLLLSITVLVNELKASDCCKVIQLYSNETKLCYSEKGKKIILGSVKMSSKII